jgi:ribonuclease Z
MFSITFLGTSASAPTPERGLPSIALNYEGNLFLFDCGEGTQRQMMKYKIGYGSIDAIFISHNHLDHYLGVYGLIETLNLSSPSPKPIKLFANELMESKSLLKRKFVDRIGIKKGKIYRGKNFTITAFPVTHTSDSFGFIFQEDDKIKFYEEKAKGMGIQGEMFSEIQKKGYVTINKKKIKLSEVSWKKPGRKVVYTGDTAICKEVLKAAKDADLLIHEATFDESRKEEATERLHSTAKDVAELAKTANVKVLILTHISPRYSDVSSLVNEAKPIFENILIAQDGMKFEL